VSPLTLVLIVAGGMLGIGLLAVLAWLVSTSYLNLVERRLARRKGLYRDLVAELAARERALLEPEIRRLATLYDLEALEAVLEEQARGTAERPPWLLDVYDRLGLVDRYIERLRSGRRWRERAFAAELLGRVGNAKAVPALLQTVRATRTEDADVREIALRALARIGDPRAVEPLIEALKTADTWLAPRIADILTRHGPIVVEPLLAVLDHSGRDPARAWAANVLGEVRAEQAFPVLVRALDDPDDEVRAKSATALGRLGDQRAMSYLLDRLLTDPAPFVRARIAATLGRFDQPEVIDRLVRALGDQAWWVRMRSVEALEHIGAQAEGPLLVALDDPDPEIRARAAVGLERLGVPAARVERIQRGERVTEAMGTLVKFASAGARERLADLLHHPSAEVRGAVLSAARRAGRGDLAPELLQTARADRDPMLRAAAFTTLDALEIRDGVRVALDGLADADARVRTAAIGLLGRLGGANVVGPLRECTADAVPGVRAAAARALGLRRGRDVASDLAGLLGDPDPEVSDTALAALGRLGDRTALPALIAAFAESGPASRQLILWAVAGIDAGTLARLADTLVEGRDTVGKLAAVRGLCRRPAPETAAVLERLSTDPEPAVRAASLQALSRTGSDAARAVAATGLTDPDEMVRAAAVDAASRLRQRELDDRLVAMLQHDPSAGVRERAALAIGLLRLHAGQAVLQAVRQRAEPPSVRAAAVLASGAFEQESLVASMIALPDNAAVREHLRERLADDPWYRLLRCRLSAGPRLELRTLTAPADAGGPRALEEGARSMLEAGERIRLVGGLRAFQGEQSRSALLQMIRGDPSPEVRTAALTAVAGLLDADELLATGSRGLTDPSLLVRRAAVGLFARLPPERAFPALLRTLRADDDPALLASVAELAEAAFPAFVDYAVGAAVDGEQALLIVRVARLVHHPELARLLPALARSGSPEIRRAIAELFRHRPGAADGVLLEGLVSDPVVGVRTEAAGAAAAAGRWDLLDQVARDPDAGVRREAALALGGASGSDPIARETLDRLGDDREMDVRAAAYVGRLVQGRPVPFPPGIDPTAAAGVLSRTAQLPLLRDIARTAPGEDRRLAAALALALVHDDVALQVARTDPAPAVRHRVSGALDLAAQARAAE
jgi:HEAT repeat protein